MRWRSWSSFAVAAAVASAGCGGAGDPAAVKPDPLPPRLARLFDYDRDAPLDVRVQDRLRTGKVRVTALSYRAPGGRVPAIVIEPRRRRDEQVGVIFMHGFGGSRYDFLEEGVGVALQGAVVVAITSPFAGS